jgi:hypothetical protein
METPSNFAKNIFPFQPPLIQLYENPWSFEGMPRGLPII